MKQVESKIGARWATRRYSFSIRTALFAPAIMAMTLVSPGARGQSIVLAQGNDDAYELGVQKGVEFLRRRQYEDALKSFKHANDLKEKKSAECFYGMAQAYQGLEAYKNAVESCARAIELAGGDPRMQAQAYNLEGLALQSQSDGKDQKKLRDAEAAFRQGLTANSEIVNLHYNLGVVLLQEGRDADGVVELKKYLELQPDPANADNARKMIENPRRARENFAPDFSITTAEGEYIALDDLKGKVVLLDFWGTWCPPCVASLPSLRDLNRKFAKEKSFVMISVSVHDQEDKWRSFIAKNQMGWHQYLDKQSKVQRAFAVNRFPTYILIDHEGIVRLRTSGLSNDRESNLEDAIHRQLKLVAKNGPSN
jgi:peroxiredoxin